MQGSSCEKKKPETNSGFKGFEPIDLYDTGAVLYKLRYQAHWGLGPVSENLRKLFGHTKPLIDNLYLKTERCIRLKLLV